MDKRVIFMGTPQIAADVLQALLEAEANVVLAVTQPDRPKGRKKQMQACEVKELALQNNIEVFQPERIRKDYARLQELQPDLIVTCAYGQIVPEEVLNIPTYGCVNLHGSLLPEYRGAAPIQRAILDGKTKSGMALMQMEKGMDTGGVMDTEVLEIAPDENSTTLFERMGQAAGRLIVKNLDTLLAGQACFEPQDESKATYAAKITPEEEHLDLSQSGSDLVNRIRALSKTPGAYVRTKGKKLKILAARFEPAADSQPGLFLNRGKKELLLGVKDGNLVLEEVQMEGKPAMAVKDFMNGQGRSLVNTKVEE